MDKRPDVPYIPCDASPREQTSDIITFSQFEDGALLSETRDNAYICGESDEDSIIPPLIIKEEIDVMDSGDESDDEPMSM